MRIVRLDRLVGREQFFGGFAAADVALKVVDFRADLLQIRSFVHHIRNGYIFVLCRCRRRSARCNSFLAADGCRTNRF
ncbi:hypothetical protein SDC9_87608 [bioreactor metagenome]|uniref:Uncharacterized protein n=1 Tax=bioreactor metagenome TaxID=1076179 RepID=A0A644ZJE3_9ZZZZ